MKITGVALVIGAGSGIGKDCCFGYAAEGVAVLILVDIHLESAYAAAEESKKYSTNPKYVCYPLSADVSQEKSVEDMVNFVVQSFGRIDYCVNCAGVGVQAPNEIANASLDEFDRFHSVNVRGTLIVLKIVSNAMKKQDIRTVEGRNGPRDAGRGVIIVMGSAASYVASPSIVQYTSSKHAVLGITRNAALDNAPYKIRVNAVCPGWVDTPMIERAVEGDPNLRGLMTRAVPMGRIAAVEEISDVIMFLSSAKASFVTGAGWLVDGGTTLMMQT